MRKNDQRARWAIILLGAVLVAELGSIIAELSQISLLKQLQNSEFVPDEDLDSNDQLIAIVAIIYTLVYIASATFFIMWFRRAYANMHTLVNNLSHTEGWAAGAWFVPILNLFRPYHIAKELYFHANRLLKNEVTAYQPLSLSLVLFWWIFWIVNNLLANFTTRYALEANDVDALLLSSQLSLVSSFINIPAGLLAMKVVYDYARKEILLWQLGTSDSGIRMSDQGNDDILDLPLE